jgi:hypothetical protein
MAGTAGKRGCGVFVARSAFAAAGDRHSDRFFLQFRSVDDPGQWRDVRPEPVMLVEDHVITFCPACGVQLNVHYAAFAEVLRRDDLVTGS